MSDREWCRQEVSGAATQQDTEEVDEYEDFVEELPSGVRDIIITGEVSIVRVNPVLLSSPIHPPLGADV